MKLSEIFLGLFMMISLSGCNNASVVQNNTIVDKIQKAGSYKDIDTNINRRFGKNLKGVLIAVGIDGSLVRINNQNKAVLIDPYATEFMKKCLEKGARVLILTGRYFDKGNMEWTIEDIQDLDKGETLSILKKSWKDVAESNGQHIDTYKLMYKYPSDEKYIENNAFEKYVLNDALFYSGILFAHRSGQFPEKGKCLQKFFELAKIKDIKNIVLIDDQEGYLEDFRDAFYGDPQSSITIVGFQIGSPPALPKH